MSQTSDRPPMPKSIRHKRILDVAAEQPDASLEAIASEIPSATADLVERVLEQHGDPAAEEIGPSTKSGEFTMTNEATQLDLEALSPKQREILRLIATDPDATQQELAERLDVSAPTISNRVNAIPGFEWEHRQEIVTTVFKEEDSMPAEEETSEIEPTPSDQQAVDEQLLERISIIEEQLNALNEGIESSSPLADPELAHKILHACMQSDAISEEEELEIVKALLR